MASELQVLIDAQRRESFQPAYRAGVSDAEACGILVAHHFEWDGDALMEMAAAALTDANFHAEAAELRRKIVEA